jgi:hypothetical protein
MSELEPGVVRQQILESGYANVPSAVSQSDMQTTMDAYLNFLELDEQFHEATRFFSTDRGDGDFGQYTRTAGDKSERGEVPDNKDIFHFGAQTRQHVEAVLPGVLPIDLTTFLSMCEEIFWASQRTKRMALDNLDHLSNGLASLTLPESGVINDVLRLIAYYPNPNKLAKGHFDRSVFTLALGESHDGLRITKGQNGITHESDEAYMNQLEDQLMPVTYTVDEAKFFLGAGWNRIPTYYRDGNHDLELGYHDVQALDKHVTERIMRWAFVLFSNPRIDFQDYIVPSPPETRPHKQFGKLALQPHILLAA